MKLNAVREGDILIVALEGRLDGTNAAKFEEMLTSEIGDGGCSVVADLENLAYISSAGLRAILLVTKSVSSKGGKLALCSLSLQIEEVFKISGFDKIIPIHATRVEAVNALG